MTTLKNWIKEQKNNLVKSEELRKQRQQKIKEYELANIDNKEKKIVTKVKDILFKFGDFNQSELEKEVKALRTNLGVGERKFRAILKKHIGTAWEAKRGENNALIFSSIVKDGEMVKNKKPMKSINDGIDDVFNYIDIININSEELNCIPEHIFISKTEIIIYFDCDFQIIDYRIEKARIKNKDDFIFWIEHLSGKNWVNREIIYEFVTKCKIFDIM